LSIQTSPARGIVNLINSFGSSSSGGNIAFNEICASSYHLAPLYTCASGCDVPGFSPFSSTQ